MLVKGYDHRVATLSTLDTARVNRWNDVDALRSMFAPRGHQHYPHYNIGDARAAVQSGIGIVGVYDCHKLDGSFYARLLVLSGDVCTIG